MGAQMLVFGWRSASALRFKAFKIGQLYSLLKNSSFVSGRRLRETLNKYRLTNSRLGNAGFCADKGGPRHT
jgi:hypothetical protein